MKKSWKRMLRAGLLTAVAAALCCFSAGALEEKGIEYVLQGDETYVTGPADYAGDLVIPSTLGGKPVTKIKGNAFWHYPYSNKLTSVTLPSTVREIEFMAFQNNSALTSVTIPEGVKIIGHSAFSGNENLKELYLPDSVTEIGSGAFGNSSTCGSGLQKIRLPKGLTKISEGMLNGCSELKSIELPASLRELGSECFARTGLTSLTIPSGITELPNGLCAYSENLKTVVLPAGLKTISRDAFVDCTSLKTAYIPTSVEFISLSAFNNVGMEEIILPYGLKTCYTGAFSNCKSLEALYVPSTVTDFPAPENSSKCIVYCTSGSTAERVCREKNISYQIDPSVDSQIHVVYNGRRISFGATGQNPVVESGRTLVPLRAIFEAMGATVGWDDATKTVTATRGGDTIKLTLGDKTLYKNGKAVMTLDVPAKSLNGRTVVPARAVAEAFGADVGWIAAAKIVTIDE